jgi:hypothetical protein
VAVYVLRDIDYAENRRFDLARIGDSTYWQPGDTIEALVVFQSPGRVWDADGVAMVDIMHPELYANDSIAGTFTTLTRGTDYSLTSRAAPPYITFTAAKARQLYSAALAYFLSVKRNGHSLQFGDTSSVPLRLQLLKPPTRFYGYPLRQAQWMNIYDLTEQDIDGRHFSLEIFRGPYQRDSIPVNPTHQNGIPFLQLFGLDNVDSVGRAGPDGKIDCYSSAVDLYRGLLIFPDRRPFDPPPGTHHSIDYPNASLNVTVPALYDAVDWHARVDSSKYYMEATILHDVCFPSR